MQGGAPRFASPQRRRLCFDLLETVDGVTGRSAFHDTQYFSRRHVEKAKRLFGLSSKAKRRLPYRHRQLFDLEISELKSLKERIQALQKMQHEISAFVFDTLKAKGRDAESVRRFFCCRREGGISFFFQEPADLSELCLTPLSPPALETQFDEEGRMWVVEKQVPLHRRTPAEPNEWGVMTLEGVWECIPVCAYRYVVRAMAERDAVSEAGVGLFEWLDDVETGMRRLWRALRASIEAEGVSGVPELIGFCLEFDYLMIVTRRVRGPSLREILDPLHRFYARILPPAPRLCSSSSFFLPMEREVKLQKSRAKQQGTHKHKKTGAQTNTRGHDNQKASSSRQSVPLVGRALPQHGPVPLSLSLSRGTSPLSFGPYAGASEGSPTGPGAPSVLSSVASPLLSATVTVGTRRSAQSGIGQRQETPTPVAVQSPYIGLPGPSHPVEGPRRMQQPLNAPPTPPHYYPMNVHPHAHHPHSAKGPVPSHPHVPRHLIQPGMPGPHRGLSGPLLQPGSVGPQVPVPLPLQPPPHAALPPACMPVFPQNSTRSFREHPPLAVSGSFVDTQQEESEDDPNSCLSGPSISPPEEECSEASASRGFTGSRPWHFAPPSVCVDGTEEEDGVLIGRDEGGSVRSPCERPYEEGEEEGPISSRSPSMDTWTGGEMESECKSKDRELPSSSSGNEVEFDLASLPPAVAMVEWARQVCVLTHELHARGLAGVVGSLDDYRVVPPTEEASGPSACGRVMLSGLPFALLLEEHKMDPFVRTPSAIPPPLLSPASASTSIPSTSTEVRVSQKASGGVSVLGGQHSNSSVSVSLQSLRSSGVRASGTGLGRRETGRGASKGTIPVSELIGPRIHLSAEWRQWWSSIQTLRQQQKKLDALQAEGGREEKDVTGDRPGKSSGGPGKARGTPAGGVRAAKSKRAPAHSGFAAAARQLVAEQKKMVAACRKSLGEMRTDVSVDMPGLAWTVHEVLGGFPMDVRCHETSAGLLSAPSAPLGLSFSSPSAPPIPLALPMSAADMDVSHAPVLKAALSLAAEVPQREKELRALINNAIVLAPEQRPRAAELLAHFLKSVGCPCGPLSGSRGSPHWRGKERENPYAWSEAVVTIPLPPLTQSEEGTLERGGGAGRGGMHSKVIRAEGGGAVVEGLKAYAEGEGGEEIEEDRRSALVSVFSLYDTLHTAGQVEESVCEAPLDFQTDRVQQQVAVREEMANVARLNEAVEKFVEDKETERRRQIEQKIEAAAQEREENRRANEKLLSLPLCLEASSPPSAPSSSDDVSSHKFLTPPSSAGALSAHEGEEEAPAGSRSFFGFLRPSKNQQDRNKKKEKSALTGRRVSVTGNTQRPAFPFSFSSSNKSIKPPVSPTSFFSPCTTPQTNSLSPRYRKNPNRPPQIPPPISNFLSPPSLPVSVDGEREFTAESPPQSTVLHRSPAQTPAGTDLSLPCAQHRAESDCLPLSSPPSSSTTPLPPSRSCRLTTPAIPPLNVSAGWSALTAFVVESTGGVGQGQISQSQSLRPSLSQGAQGREALNGRQVEGKEAARGGGGKSHIGPTVSGPSPMRQREEGRDPSSPSCGRAGQLRMGMEVERESSWRKTVLQQNQLGSRDRSTREGDIERSTGETETPVSSHSQSQTGAQKKKDLSSSSSASASSLQQSAQAKTKAAWDRAVVSGSQFLRSLFEAPSSLGPSSSSVSKLNANEKKREVGGRDGESQRAKKGQERESSSRGNERKKEVGRHPNGGSTRASTEETEVVWGGTRCL
uniref:Uncharacterized protein n=1 Tax=Chromera velia CCMP2878 TaxID=1169474 RepID=A0A0G4FQC9_9ALVE|eukprot:Cvel_3637.t1-p1 / transcript=Cvel_3637.t1 / gene=Cvel_3637 / organism=Chromera_velia_CCMP2878 / gene_product=hypothetical protein / transcript_product=hypothetical protein / location=Cvel_scaffold149:113152-120625(-) / protein_length=1754 / sequence_SO=supercontig / SO=protein_coding / is_pseudo=false